WPEVDLFSRAFSRAWMGGSVGIFALMGGLSYFSSRKWFIYGLVFVFELFLAIVKASYLADEVVL
ncbi:MAG: hypothetical protein RLN88_06505, partial [Ekhidna sp.]|uniref:hypothetical protein n=1 Tax=Ekhidna sp. TaxID=2608089 RepID=UPI0032EB6879